MLTFGFFDSVNGDRVYNADQMSNYFKGLISDGVYQSVGSAMQVTAGNGMNVSVGAGRAIVNSKWANNDGVVSLAISPASSAYPRYTTVVLRLDEDDRTIELDTVDGTPAASPEIPEPVRVGAVYELVLAQIYIPANSTEVFASNITDTRPNSELCGWVTSLVQNLDTEDLFNQWTAAYTAQFEAFRTAYEAWFETLTQDLNVNTYIEKYSKTEQDNSVITLDDITDYTYEASDIIQVFVNGLKLRDDQFAVLDMGFGPFVRISLDVTNADVEVVIFKSKIGFTV